MSRTSVVYTCYGKKLGESAKAIKFLVMRIPGVTEEAFHSKVEWFPFSQVSKMFSDKDNRSDEDYIIVSEWILEQKGYMTESNRVGAEAREKKKYSNADLIASDGKPEVKEAGYFDDMDDDIPF